MGVYEDYHQQSRYFNEAKREGDNEGFSLIYEGVVAEGRCHGEEAIEVEEQQSRGGEPRGQAYDEAENLTESIPERPAPDDGRRQRREENDAEGEIDDGQAVVEDLAGLADVGEPWDDEEIEDVGRYDEERE